MTATLRTLLLCAALLFTSTHSVVHSASSSASSLSSFSPVADASSSEELMLRINPDEDAQLAETLYVQPSFVESHVEPSAIPAFNPYRRDSMEGASGSYAASASDHVSSAEADVEASSVQAAEHSMHTMQSSAQFTMQRRTAAAPFSHRIQPGLMYRTREIQYQQVRTGNVVRLGAGYLMLYEGAMTNRTGTTTNIENDVWVSNDDGQTWDLAAGKSEYGPSGPTSSPQAQTFSARSGSNNCNDPQSDLIISLGGNDWTTASSTNVTYSSNSGLTWSQQTSTYYAPVRHFSSCDITDRGDVMLIGGHFHVANNQPADYLLNDVWRGTGVLDSAYALTWRRQTANAPFAAREEHLVLVGYSSYWKREIIYVIGGKTSCLNADCYDGRNSNDVWASSDYGVTWAQLTAAAPFGQRWGHGGWLTGGEVLLVWGGLNSATGLYGDTVTWRDMWASFDGGFTWNQCDVGSNTAWIRGEQGVAVNSRGQLVLVAGYAYQENGNFQVRYNDVWRSDFNVENTANLAARCGGGGSIPAGGAGLRRWPGATAVPTTTLTFTPATLRAPWSPRYKAGLLLMSQPLTYKTPEGITANTGADWLLMYEGQGLVSSDVNANENDVYASADSGKTWQLISGYSFRGQTGYKASATPLTSFSGKISSANCEDPTTDDVYTIGGLAWSGGAVGSGPQAGFWSSQDAWHSTNALVWNRTNTAGQLPARHGATCDVGHSRNILLIGGVWTRYENGASTTNYYNDVWQSVNTGRTWIRVTAAARFTARRDHAMQITYSDYYGADLVYVVGGRGLVNNVLTSFNDVWVSSDAGRNWAQVVQRAQFAPRYEASVVVTSTGAMLLIGGRGQGDIWASLNGGQKWSVCTTIGNQSVSDSSAVALTGDDRLVIASGSPRADVLLSDDRLNTNAQITKFCRGATVSESGVGLRDMPNWTVNGTDSGGGDDQPNTDSSSAGGLSGLAIVGIVAAVLVALAAAYGYWRWQQKQSSGGSTSDPIALLGGTTHNGAVEGQVHNSNALDSSLLHDTDSSHSSL